MSRTKEIRERLDAYNNTPAFTKGESVRVWEELSQHAPGDIAYLLEENKRLAGQIMEMDGVYKRKEQLQALEKEANIQD